MELARRPAGRARRLTRTPDSALGAAAALAIVEEVLVSGGGLPVTEAGSAAIRLESGSAAAAKGALGGDESVDSAPLRHLASAAAAAVASKHLAVGRPRSLGIIGCGDLAVAHLRCHRTLFGDIEVRVADIDRDSAIAFAAREGAVAVSVERAAACAIVCCAGAATQACLRLAATSDGMHLNALASPAGVALLLSSAPSAVLVLGGGSGDRALGPLAVHGTLAEVARGEIAGRIGSERTVFSPIGLPDLIPALSRALAGELPLAQVPL